MLALSGLAIITLVGCQPVPTELETPEIVWITEAGGPLESDPWLEAAHASDLGLRLAYNARDFTISQLTETWSASSVKTIYSVYRLRFVEGGAKPEAFPGPAVWLPLEITESADGQSAEVTVCVASEGWLLTADGETPLDIDNGHEFTFEMGKDSATGNIVLLNTSGPSDACDATGAAVGRFDPQPDPPAEISESDVRAPLG